MLGANLDFKTYIGYFELFGERAPLSGIYIRMNQVLSNLETVYAER